MLPDLCVADEGLRLGRQDSTQLEMPRGTLRAKSSAAHLWVSVRVARSSQRQVGDRK